MTEETSPIKRALLEIRELRAKLDAAAEPIAIVGIGCRFPGGANDPDSLWRLLVGGADAIREVPPERWDVDALYDADPAAPGKMSTRWGGFIDGVDEFDPRFFSISPREAMAMDPQQRLLLEVAWEALENAGQAPDRLAGSASGVFVGISSFDYVHLAMAAPRDALGPALAQGIAHSAASGRLAYVLGLQGPAASVDTACSSSLLAVHLAVQSLRRGESRLALAGGVNAILLPTFQIGFSKSQMMAADGRCKTFDARADGFVRGEGCGVVVLKRLSDALADRDEIWAVIRGSAANQDGRSSGMTAPNGPAQEAVVRAALADARVPPALVGYVEAHGTGTALGDPIELQALGAALGDGRPADRPVLVGSLKTNVGHLEAAAGVAGVIKAALALRHGELPPSLHFDEPNPYVPWSELPVRVATGLQPFPEAEGRRIAGVSSFGFTGTNVHVVMEAVPALVAEPAAAPGTERPLHLLKLSARDAGALDRLAARWAEHLHATRDRFTDLCFTANTGRADLPERLAVVAASAAEAADRLAAHLRGDGEPLPRATARPGEVAFLFSGHGAQYPGMARGLAEAQPTFRAALEQCDALLRPYLERPLLSVLLPDGDAAAAEAERLLTEGMTYSQPALFAVEYALARLWRSWGVEPAYVLGHSVGEYVAACEAGVFDLADGLKLVAARGRLMDALPARGSMLAVFAPRAEAEALLAPHAGRASVAAVNGPSEVVLSGEAAAIDEIAGELSARGAEFRRLAVAQAGHSHLLDPMLDEFEAVAATVRFAAPRLGLVSCTTGRLVAAAEVADARYWRRHLRETVQFADALGTLHRDGCRFFLELGPHTNLAAMAGRCLPEGEALCAASLRRGDDDWRQLFHALAALWSHGVPVDWAAFERDHLDARGAPRRRVRAPTYAWSHRRYWLEHAAPEPAAHAVPAAATWRAVVDAGRRQQAQGPLDLALPRFPERWAALARLTTTVVADTLGRLGAFDAGTAATTADEVVHGTGVVPQYRRLVARWLRRLADAGLVEERDGRFAPGDALARIDVAGAWRDAEPALDDWPFMLDYLRRCAALLPDVLAGRQNPLETIFPGGSFDCADQLYRDSVMPRYYNALVGAVVSAFAAGRGAPPRVLEVGGGTGGTTATLLPIVEAAGGAYHFTDVSDLFLARAAERFGERACMSFGLLDVDADLDTQGYAGRSFDGIVAANVLHAASDIPRTLERLRSLLAPGGILVFVEVTTYLDWFDISTALLEGWDRQGDALRAEHPMLSASAWLDALRGAGFADAAAFPGDDSPAAVMAQHVLVAQAPAGDDAHDRTDAYATADDARRDAGRARAAEAEAFAARLAAAPPHERDELLVEYVRRHIAALLRLEAPEHIDRNGRLMELGLDSLMAVELRSRLAQQLALSEPLPATLIFDYPSVDAIVALLSRLLDPGTFDSTMTEVPVPALSAAPPNAELDALSDAEVEARLLARLEDFEARTQQ